MLKKNDESRNWPEGAVSRKIHWHFLRRLYERYRIVLGPGELPRVVKSIKEGEALLIEKSSEERGIFCIHLRRGKKRVPVFVTATADGTLFTALPPRRSMKQKVRKLS